MKRVLLILVGFMSLFTLAACYGDDRDPNTIRLNVANDTTAFTTFQESTPYTNLNGEEYKIGDFLPYWETVGDTYGLKLVDAVSSYSSKTQDRFNASLLDGFKNEDITSGKLADFNTYSSDFLNLLDYADDLPNLMAFLDENEAYMPGLLNENGGLYFAPYFDGMDDVKLTFLIREDWVSQLLDTNDFSSHNSQTVVSTAYSAFYKDGHLDGATNTGTYATADGGTVIKKGTDYNIVTQQNALSTANGQELCSLLATHIDYVVNDGNNTYDGHNGYSKRSEYFTSGAAAYDADELIALMRCAKANPTFLRGDEAKTIIGCVEDEDGACVKDEDGNTTPVYAEDTDITIFYVRESKQSRYVAVEHLAQIWGMRGADTPLSGGFAYVNDNGELVHKIGEEDTYDYITYLNQLYQEGLIQTNYDESLGSVTNFRTYFFQNNDGFITFDYNASTTVLNDTTVGSAAVCTENGVTNTTTDTPTASECFGTNMVAILPPLVQWFDDVADEVSLGYERFYDSVRTLKTDGWGIPAHVADNAELLANVLAVFDFPYSDKGHIMMSYGTPEYWVEADADYLAANETEVAGLAAGEVATEYAILDWEGTKYEANLYQGVNYPVLSETTFAHIAERTNGHVANFFAKYLTGAASIGHVRPLERENQTNNAQGVIGQSLINSAIDNGALSIPKLTLAEGDSYSRILTPAALATTTSQQGHLDNIAAFTTNWNDNIVLIIQGGWSATGVPAAWSTREGYYTDISAAYNTWKTVYTDAYRAASGYTPAE